MMHFWGAVLAMSLILLTPCGRAAVPGGVYDVRSFGATGDGKALDTDAINRAITAAADAGGGEVRFPAGTYRSTSIHLRSNVALYLGPGATVEAAPSGNGITYDTPEPNPTAGQYQDFGHAHWHNSLLWGEGLENVSIVGSGRLLGTGLSRDNRASDIGQGNKTIALKNCRNVTLRDITIQHGGWFGILATGVDNLTIDNLKIDTNRDGMDIDCCRNVRVSNCTVNSPRDDGICLKSSYGLGFARATENVTITGCQVSGYAEGALLDGTGPAGSHTGVGRIKFGTESNGGFKNIAISDCVFDHCDGLALETVDGGLLEDVTISNLTMRDIANAPIFLRLGSRLRGPAGTTVGELRRVSISHVRVDNAAPRCGCILSGIPGHALEDVRLSDIRILFRGGGTKAQAALDPPERETAYPEPSMFGDTPAYGFYVRHVQGLELSDIRLNYQQEDQRPALVLNDVRDADLDRMKAQHAPQTPVLVQKGVSGLRGHQTEGVEEGPQG